jgi:hypothetical protein
VRQSGETFCKPCSDSVLESSETKLAKTSKKSTQKKIKKLDSLPESESNTTGQGFELDSPDPIELDSPDPVELGSPAIGQEVTTGETVSGIVKAYGFKYATITTDQGKTVNVKLNSVKPRPGHFTQGQLDEMVQYELDRLDWAMDRAQSISRDIYSKFIEDLTPNEQLALVYQLRRYD